jgi:predicted nucleic acid-binding protein
VAVYLDSSAFVKLILAEPHSTELRAYLGGAKGRHTSSALLRAESIRALRQSGPDALALARVTLRAVDLIAIADSILDAAGMLEPQVLRTLDAIHLATAITLGDDLDAIVTYDTRMAEGARLMGLPVSAP